MAVSKKDSNCWYVWNDDTGELELTPVTKDAEFLSRVNQLIDHIPNDQQLGKVIRELRNTLREDGEV